MKYTVGDLLQRARAEKKLTLEEVEKRTRIRSKYLEAIEQNKWTIFPSKVYISGIIRSYASFLGMDPNKAIAYFRRDYEKRDDVKFRKRLPSLNFLPETKKIVIGIIIVIVLFFSAYFGYQLTLYFAPPEIKIVSPEKNIFRNVDRIRVVGETEKDATVTILGDNYFPNEDGRFVYELPVKKGKNSITINVTGANGRTSSINQEYVLE
jgi:cytoskeletal protein RodZ